MKDGEIKIKLAYNETEKDNTNIEVMGDSIFPDILPFKKAIEFFQNKIPISYDELIKDYTLLNKQYFYITNVTNKDFVVEIKKLLDKSIKEGISLPEFQKHARKTVDNFGITKVNNNRLDLIYRTNMLSSYGYGRVISHYDDFNIKVMPYLQYIAVMDQRTRPTHMALNGVCLPKDSDFWNNHYPPWDFRCRCTVISLSKSMIDSRNIKISNFEKIKTFLPKENNFSNPKKIYNIGIKAIKQSMN